MDERDPKVATIMVPSEDPEKKEDDKPKHDKGKLAEKDADLPDIVG